MCLLGVLRGLTPEEVLAGIEFDVKRASPLEELAPPREGELRLLREEIDPSGIIIRGETVPAAR